RMARAAQEMMGNSEIAGLRTAPKKELEEADQGTGGASDDIGEVSWNVPTVRLRYAANIPGMTAHHWSSGIAMATPIAHKGSNYASRILAMTALDLLTTPRLLADARQYFNDVQTKNAKWVSLIPRGTEPPTFLNAEQMRAVRPRLEALKYDPSRYATYLEQLGIEYPTVRAGTNAPPAAPARPQN
ncbi:MAG: amidohydrolase, partial [Gemmatimonadetes bacterium]|nr:amidohydrolase [Gemmatimonadota bacterium]